MKNKILVTGTGRAGTSLLMAIFTKMELDTGFKESDIARFNNDKACCGLEDFNRNAYIIKRPIPDNMPTEMFVTKHKYDLIIIPIRKLKHSSDSRIRIHEMGLSSGSLTHNGKPSNQYNNNAIFLGELVSEIIMRDIPYLFIKFPEFVYNFDYFWNTIAGCEQLTKLKFTKEIAQKAWCESVKPGKVHIK